MRQVLFYIPIRGDVSLGPLGDVPLFGFGLLLVVWLLFAAGSLWSLVRQRPVNRKETGSSIAFLLAVAVVIVEAPALSPVARLPVFGYGAMLVLAVVFSGWTAAWRAPLAGASRQFAWDMTVKLVFAGVVGSRLFHLIQYHEVAFRGCQTAGDYLKAAVMLPDGGLVLYGGLILAGVTYLVLCRRHAVHPLKFGDAVVPAVFVGIAFGRLGCFLNGCCFGDVCHLPWAVTFPHDSVPWKVLVERGLLDPDAAATLPLHPTQLYSTLNALVLAFATGAYYRYRKGDGSVVGLALMLYAVSRSCLEILRNDEAPQFGTGLTISQLVSAGVFVLGAGLAWWSWTHCESKLRSSASDSNSVSTPA